MNSNKSNNRDIVKAIILAAGKSSRFNNQRSKLLEKICGQEMILYITKLLANLNIKTTLVVGYQKEKIQEIIKKNHNDLIDFVEQKIQLGTGHAIKTALNYLENNLENIKHILVLNGDIPLIDEELISKLIDEHLDKNATISFIGAYNFDPSIKGYGTIVKENDSIKIVEAKEWGNKIDHQEISLLNAGIYIFEKDFLITSLDSLQASSITGELYITDLIKIANDQKRKIEIITASFDNVRGVNTLEELWIAEQIKKSELVKKFMQKGVRFKNIHNVLLDLNVSIGSGSVIGNCVEILDGTIIGESCEIDSFSIIKNSILADNIYIEPYSILDQAHIKNNIKNNLFANNFVKVKSNKISEK